MTLAAAQASDLLVLVAAALGALLAITGLASFDRRVRSHLPVAVLARGNARAALGFIVAGLLLVTLALGVGE